MRKALKFLLKGVGLLAAVVVLLVVVLFSAFAISRTRSVRAARAEMGRPADTLRVEGLAFRDLNKNGKLDPYEDRRQPVALRVEDLLKQMTLEEKAGLLFHNFVMPGGKGEIASPLNPSNLLPVEVALFDKKMRFFNMYVLGTAEETARWTNAVQRLAERSRLGIPVVFSSDPRHSALQQMALASFSMREFSQWTEPIGLAAIGDSALAEEFGRIAAQEYRAVGIQMALHPMADLATEPRWGRISGTFGEDAQLSARLTAAYVRGFQGDSLGPTSVATVTKHFAGGGPQEDGWDPHFRYGKNQVYPGHNLPYHLVPFRAAIAAHTAAIMPYYGVPVGLTNEDVGFGFNRQMITGLLRDTLGFNGVVMTDWGLLTENKVLGVNIERFLPFAGAKDYGVEQLTPPERARKALDAGVDQFGGESHPEYIVELVKRGKVPVARIDQSVRRLLALEFQLGLFDDPYVDVGQVAARVGTPEARRLGEETQRRSQVLLTDKVLGTEPILPLKAGTRIYVQNLDTALARRYGTVVKTPGAADIAILNLAPPFDRDRGTFVHQGRLNYTAEELGPLLATMRQKPTVVTIYLERPVVIPEIVQSAQAVVGNFGVSQAAILDVLFGRAKPEGKLPFDLPSSWASVLRQKPDVPFDAEQPLFRFGYGLRYGGSTAVAGATPTR